MVCDLSPHRRDFVSRSVHVGSVVYEVALEQVALRVLRISPVTIIPPLLYAHLHIHTATRRIKGDALEPSKKECCFGNREALDAEVIFIPVSPLQLFYTPLAPLRITRCDVKKIYVLRPQYASYVLYESQNKRRVFPYSTSTGFYNPAVMCLLCGTI